MSMKTPASVLLALSAMLLIGCGGDSGSEAADEGASAQAKSGCTERDGAWFGRTADGAMITSQTREACEERAGK
jgi:hypothetical protein